MSGNSTTLSECSIINLTVANRTHIKLGTLLLTATVSHCGLLEKLPILPTPPVLDSHTGSDLTGIFMKIYLVQSSTVIV